MPEDRTERDIVDKYIDVFIGLAEEIQLADKKGFDTIGFMISRTYRDKIYDAKLDRWAKSTKDKAPLKVLKKIATVIAGAVAGMVIVALV